MFDKTLTDEELALLKRGLTGLTREITEWMPKPKLWFLSTPDPNLVEAGRDVLSKIETLLSKLDTINHNPAVLQDIEGYD